MTTILIAGVAGFIGSNYAHYVANKHPEYRLTGIDKLTPYSSRKNISDLEATGHLTFLQADITDLESMIEIYRENKFDFVINFAAESHNDRAIRDPSSFVYANVNGAQTLLEASRLFEVRRHIHISTIEVYGEQGDNVPFFTEASPLNAKTPYSASKAAGDLIVRSYMQTYPEMDILLTHCANNYGPYQFPEKLIPLAITSILRGKKASLYGDGLQLRDWLHVYDHCSGIDKVLHSPRKTIPNEAATKPELLPIYDFSARQELSNRHVLEMICKALEVKFDDHVQFVTDRPNHDRRYLINPRKAEKDLNFAPGIKFEDGIEQTVAWYVDNEAWWLDIINRSGELAVDWSAAN